MSDTMAALLILPFLIALVISLECARTGCTWLSRRLQNNSRPTGIETTPEAYSSSRL